MVKIEYFRCQCDIVFIESCPLNYSVELSVVILYHKMYVVQDEIHFRDTQILLWQFDGVVPKNAHEVNDKNSQALDMKRSL